MAIHQAEGQSLPSGRTTVFLGGVESVFPLIFLEIIQKQQ